MITCENSPVGWASLMYELDDAHEHLGKLIGEMCANRDFDEDDLRIQLGHVYAHLNRAWCRRNVHDDFTPSERTAASRFPTDLEPVG